MKAMSLIVSFIVLSISAMGQTNLDLALLKERQNKNSFLFPLLKQQFPLLIYKSPIKDLGWTFTDCFKPDISLIAPIPTPSFHPQGTTIPNPYIIRDKNPVDSK